MFAIFGARFDIRNTQVETSMFSTITLAVFKINL